jgi:hypothetical protein
MSKHNRRTRILVLATVAAVLGVASLAVPGAALAATGDLTFAACHEDDDFNAEGASCVNAPGLGFPRDIAVSGDGTEVYVVTAGDGAIVRFSRNPSTGVLNFEDCIEDEDLNNEGTSCANAPGLAGAHAIAPSADGSSVYVATGGLDHAIVHFSRNPSTGVLTFQGCIEDEDSGLEAASCANAPGLDNLRDVAMSGDGTSVYVVSAGDSAITQLSRNTGTGAISFEECTDDEDLNTEGPSCGDAPGLAQVAGLAMSGSTVYTSSAGDGAITRFSRDSGTGALSFQDCIEDDDQNSEGLTCANAPALSQASDLALAGGGTSVYLAATFDGAITHLSRDPGTGMLAFEDCIEDEDLNNEGTSCANAPGLEGAVRVSPTADGASVYTAAVTNDAIAHFSRDLGTGTLGFENCIEDEDTNPEGANCANAPGLDDATGLTVSGDGSSVYTTSNDDHAIVRFSREIPSPPPAEPPADGGGADTTPPDTTITKGPKAKTKKKQATFEFTSTEPGSSFQCAVDAQALKVPCTSPFTTKVKKGKHTFQVRATDSAGNTDPTPASQGWAVKKKRRKG